jgi:hypothetical protein
MLHMRTHGHRIAVWSALSRAALFAACGSNEALPDNAHQDAAPTGLGGSTSSGGTVAAGGASAGSGGAAGTVGTRGAAGSSVTAVAASGGTTTIASTGGQVTGSGGISGVGGATGGASASGGNASRDAATSAGGQAGLAGTNIDASVRDGVGAGDLIATPPDASKNDVPTADVAADAARPDGLSSAQQEYVNTFAQPYCTRLAECCIQAGFPAPSLAACEQDELGFVKHLGDGTSVIDPTAIQTILSGLTNSCDQPSYALLGSTTKGTRQSGEACDDSAQCSGSPVVCLGPEGASTTGGKCMTPPRGKVGDGCTVTCDDYTTCSWTTSGGKAPYAICYDQDGLRCDSVSSTCVSVTAVGAKCSDFNECGEHAECDNGVCQAKKKLGADCGTGAYCDSGLECRNTGDGIYKCVKYSIAWSGSCSP